MGKANPYVVYIVQCKYGTYYTGCTPDLKKRIQEHDAGQGAKYLRGKGPVQLVYVREYPDSRTALREERRIKTLSRRQKQDLIGSDEHSGLMNMF